MSTTVSKIFTYYLIKSYLLKSITPPSRMFYLEIFEIFRSSHRSCFMKKGVLKNFAIFTGKLQVRNFIKNRLQHRCFPLNIAKFLRTPISKNICSVNRWSCFLYYQQKILSSDNLLTGYEQLSYQQFNRNILIHVT